MVLTYNRTQKSVSDHIFPTDCIPKQFWCQVSHSLKCLRNHLATICRSLIMYPELEHWPSGNCALAFKISTLASAQDDVEVWNHWGSKLCHKCLLTTLHSHGRQSNHYCSCAFHEPAEGNLPAALQLLLRCSRLVGQQGQEIYTRTGKQYCPCAPSVPAWDLHAVRGSAHNTMSLQLNNVDSFLLQFWSTLIWPFLLF